jgi:hypothetical protein
MVLHRPVELAASNRKLGYFQIDVANRVYHHRSQTEIASAKRIYQQLHADGGISAELWAKSVAAAEQNADDVFRRATGAHKLFS